MKELVDALVRAGSTAAMSATYGEEASAQALEALRESCPPEIRTVWPLMLTWGRYQAAYEVAERLGDASGMVRASEAQQKLLMGLY